MNLKRLALLVMLGALIGLTVFWVPGRFSGSADGQDAIGPSGSSSRAVASETASEAASEAASEPGSGSGSRTASTAPEPATEALPRAGSTPTDPGLPGLGTTSRTKPVALVSEPLPRSVVRKGSLAAGYPKALDPPARTSVQISSLSPARGVLQVALTATCRRPCDVLRHFRIALGRHGFEEVSTASVENAPTAALRRGKDTVSVTVERTSHRSVEYSLFAVLHTKS